MRRLHEERPALARTRAPRLYVRALSAAAVRGRLHAGGLSLPCAIGRKGRRALKREGDGASPVGSFRIERLLFRPDRMRRPVSGLPSRPMQPNDGWCDAVGDRNYNRPVRHPYPASAEHLWRADGLYDIVVILDHNQRPRVACHGSAIFMHIARDDWQGTAGCIALRRADLLRLIAWLRPGARLCILP